MSIFELGISSTDAIQLYPGYDYVGDKKQIRSDHRTRGGKNYSYKWADFKRFKFKVEWLSTANASIINSWFDARTELLFFVTSSTITEVHSVMLMNNETPLSKYNKPYDNYMKGTILLEEY